MKSGIHRGENTDFLTQYNNLTTIPPLFQRNLSARGKPLIYRNY